MSFGVFFQVVIEGLVERKSWGDIAVDDIKVLDGLSITDCKGEAFSAHSFFTFLQFVTCVHFTVR